jgi:5-methylcytosine-specific restriction endonuclease McrA
MAARKMTNEHKASVVEYYATGAYTQMQIANILGLSKGQVRRALHPDAAHLYYLKNKDRIVKAALQYREDHLEQVIAVQKQYYQKNKNRIRSKNDQWAKDNPKKCRAAENKYRQANPDVSKRAGSKWRLKNLDKCANFQQQRRAKLRGNYYEKVTKQDILDLKNEFNHTCVYCFRSIKLTIDHVVPVDSGGAHAIWNMVPACSKCNSSKHNKDMHEWLFSGWDRIPAPVASSKWYLNDLPAPINTKVCSGE